MRVIEEACTGAYRQHSSRIDGLHEEPEVVELRLAPDERAQCGGRIGRRAEAACDKQRVHAARDLEVLLQPRQRHENGGHVALLGLEGKLTKGFGRENIGDRQPYRLTQVFALTVQ